MLLLCIVFALQMGLAGAFDWRVLAVRPLRADGLFGVLAAPLLHGSPEHLLMNAIALLLLGTLSGVAYPRATLRALPLIWLGSGLAAWTLGEAGSHHVGASGLSHGLMFLVFVLGLLRRDRASVAAGMVAFFFYGGMLLTILPRELDVSWQSHLGGALAGALAAVLLRRVDPLPPRKQYSWELEEEDFEQRMREDVDAGTLEPPRPQEVPVLWRREPEDARAGAKVLPFPTRRPPG